MPPGGKENFSNGYLPANFQATPIQATGVPVANIEPADEIAEIQSLKLKWHVGQDTQFAGSLGGNSTIEAAIRNYELAYRMQGCAPEAVDT